jgi:hypothetical protein
MKRTYQILLISAIAISIAIVAAVCLHSLEEIHYLKSFYPRQFTVQEAFYASAVELIKVLIISLPLFLVTAAALYLLGHFKKEH